MTTMGAVPVSTITCPPWCSVSQGTHQRELRWEGRALHWSDARTGEGWEIRHTSATDTEGNPIDIEPTVYVNKDSAARPFLPDPLRWNPAGGRFDRSIHCPLR